MLKDDLRNIAQNELMIGGSTIPGVYIITPLIKRFHERRPEVKIALHIEDTKKIIDMVSQGMIEMGVVGSKHDDKRLHFQEFMRDELVLAVATIHPWRDRTEIYLDELKQQPFILREVGSGTRTVIEKLCLKHGIDPRRELHVVCELSSTEAVKQGILAGVGISILSRLAVERELKYGLIKAIKIKGLPLERMFYLVSNIHRVKSTLCEEFLKLL